MTTAIFAKNLQVGDKLGTPRAFATVTEVRIVDQRVTVFTKGTQTTLPLEAVIEIL